MPEITVDLDRSTYRRLVRQSVDNLRPVQWEAEHILRGVLDERAVEKETSRQDGEATLASKLKQKSGGSVNH
jgi:membrane protein involved in colicin uptake